MSQITVRFKGLLFRFHASFPGVYAGRSLLVVNVATARDILNVTRLAAVAWKWTHAGKVGSAIGEQRMN